MARLIRTTRTLISDLKPGDIFIPGDADVEDWLQQKQETIPVTMYLGRQDRPATALQRSVNPVVLKVEVWEETDGRTIRGFDRRQSWDANGPATSSKTYVQ